jgi:chromosome segregation ATPase
MSEPQLQQQTRTWLTAMSADLRHAIQEESQRLRAIVEERIAVLEGVVSASDKQLDQVAVNVVGLAERIAQEAVAQARQEMEAAAHAELTTVRERLQGDLETMRTEFESNRIALEVQLAETESDIWAIRQKRDELASSLNQTRERMAALEQANGQATLHRELAEARLEEEVQRRVAVEKQLETSRQELVLARAEAESRRLEAQVAVERVHALRKAASPVFDKRNDTPPKVTVERPPSVPDARKPQVREGESAGPSAEVLQFSVNRRARRVKIHAAGEILIDGVASMLVDISTLGAQVLSPTTLRPSRVVRLTLRTDSGACTAEGRIVWAQLESSTAEAGAHYRAGVQFTTSDLAAINALVAQQGLPQVATAS